MDLQSVPRAAAPNRHRLRPGVAAWLMVVGGAACLVFGEAWLVEADIVLAGDLSSRWPREVGTVLLSVLFLLAAIARRQPGVAGIAGT
jgi:hypothetical protein